MKRIETEIDNLANSWVRKMADFYPSYATSIGYPGGEADMDDHSPEALAQGQADIKNVIAELTKLAPTDDVDIVTKEAMLFSLEGEIESYESGLSFRNLNNIASPAQGIRDIFDISPTATIKDWENIASRMRKVPQSLEGYGRSLKISAANNDAPAKRQLEEVIAQADQIASEKGFFRSFAASAKADGQELPESLKKELIEAAEEATKGYADFRETLKAIHAISNTPDAIGRERYQMLSSSFLGATVDLDETYKWGIEELARIVAEQNEVANQILPGASVEEAIKHLENDPSTKLHGTEELQKWMQKLSDNAIEALSGTHFEIAEPLKKLECMIAPTQHGGIYYTGPSDDFSRPGRMWWSVPVGVTEFDTWRETTTVYHEGVPGHHLQVAQATYVRDTLNAWRRLASWTSGHGEGWALYAERLMEELGFLDNPADRLGMLDGQRMRAARVVLDIGVHLGKERLDGKGVWDFDYALDFMGKNVNMSKEFVRFEVTRYFGWPGQAPSYKVGQRIWEQIRDDYKARKGESFDIKEFHKTALNLGGLGLDTLEKAMARA
ncbi:DUF885 domain-containing protein [Candidatus Aquiluna sp. UB-MaderosW2red]|uniref:DUF885 domain-containing protein n=1 Tax=Candidatus Aquiluna sp. UB-MaderosW2red TaxID=1855377 RepID=UPI000875AE7A|nr:DUF885 domain-containing protein [Candidatus Aquiluna sp. UB-MaderosW2red]SCX10045.1 Uncharacterized conserved protein, DUF885 familyt [Candidatus Aquiluna sp. UB-MaderosW2red]